MTNLSIEPEIDTPDRLDRNADTSGTEGGKEPGGRRPEGREKSSNRQN